MPPLVNKSLDNSNEIHPPFFLQAIMAFFQSKQAEHAAPAANIDYLLSERVSSQWSAFLTAFSTEIQNQLSPQEYRELLRSMGSRFGALLDIGERETVEGMADGINGHLKSIRWGRVRLADNGDQLLIEHHYSPLPQALGVDAELAGGFLEGMYEHWFKSAGADEALSVKQLAGASTASVTVFQFGRHA
jgi:Cellulose synthase subunit D